MESSEEPDYAEAVKLVRQAADQGYAVAQDNLGDLYYSGQGVGQDYAEAAKWYRKAADQGYAAAQTSLGKLYYSGQGVGQDYAEAVKLVRQAADQGYAVAQDNLGDLYYSGQGVTQDYAEAAKWYRKAADQGYAVAQVSLGDFYSNGKGEKQNFVEAVKWYRKAADQGNGLAQLYLGHRYMENNGVEQDLTEAKKWYAKAAEHKDEELKKSANAGLRSVESYPKRRAATIQAWKAMQKADSEARKFEDPFEQVSKVALLYSDIELDDADKDLAKYVEHCLENFKAIRRVLVRVKQDKQQLLQDKESARGLAVLVGALFGRALNERDPNSGAVGGALLGELAAAGLSESAIDNLRTNYKEVFDSIDAWEKRRAGFRKAIQGLLQNRFSSKFLDAID